METAEFWKTLFENWPDVIQRQGTVITKQGDSIPFIGFLISGGLLLLERDGPDAAGSRKIIVAYDSISVVKLLTAAELSKFYSMGFQPPL